MKKYWKIILPAALIIIGIVGYYAYSEYNREHVDVSDKKADVVIQASELAAAFNEDENAANALYNDKAIAVSGIVSSVDKDAEGAYTIMLIGDGMLSNVSCQMDARHNESAKDVQVGSTITVKGYCTGMLMDVVLIRCAIDKE